MQTFRRDCRFPAVLAAHVVEHFTDPAEALRLLSACLSPAGRLYLVDLRPHWCNWLIWIRFRHRWFSPQTLRRFRIMRALETLATTNAPITQSDLSVGYGSLSGFNAAFRAQMGMPPPPKYRAGFAG